MTGSRKIYSFTDPSVAQKTNTAPGGGLGTGAVGRLTPLAEYSFRWFDPINGEYLSEGVFTASPGGNWDVEKRPAATDMALLIRKKN